MRKTAAIIITIIVMGCGAQGKARIEVDGDWRPEICDRYMADHGCEE